MSNDVPEWAKKKAVELAHEHPTESGATETWALGDVKHWSVLTAFARYIAEHEEPPVDPLLGVVGEAIAGTAEKGAAQLREALARRGFKIVEAPQ